MFHLSSSGSNNYYLYHAASDTLRSKYEIELLTREQVQYNRFIDHSDVYITTHGEYSSNYDKVNIDLWHGFPLKGMAKMDHQENTSDEHIHAHWNKVDLIMSYSGLYNTAMNACNGANISQYRITGMPRNDALFQASSRDRLNELFPNLSQNNKVIFFMPTFRKSILTPEKLEGAKDFTNIFGLPEFDRNEFISFLKENNLSLIIKLHPFEENYFSKELSDLAGDSIHVLSDAKLSQQKLDLYDILGATDMLITDYSSVYIDFLLLKRPILFLPTDLHDYQRNRGLLLEPYDFWAPGPKLFTQTELLNALERFTFDTTWYENERNTILKLCHSYQDDQATERIWEQIDQYIQSNLETILYRRKTFQNHKQMQLQVKKTIQGIIEQGHLSEANAAIQQYLESNSADPDIFSMNGMLHLLNGDPQEAIRSFLQGHQHFPWDEDLLYNLGYVYESIGKLTEALSFYKKSLSQSLKPEMTTLLKNKLQELKL